MAAPQRVAFDSGAVIALAHGKPIARSLLRAAEASGAYFLIPAPVLSEVLRGTPQDASVNRIVRLYEVVPTGERAARSAGAMLHGRSPALAMDALICATAATAGADAIWTQDAADLESLVPSGLRVVSVN